MIELGAFQIVHSNFISKHCTVGVRSHNGNVMMQSNTDAEAWNLEVERVAPQLKVELIHC